MTDNDLTAAERMDQYQARCVDAVDALAAVIEDPEASHEPQRAALLEALSWLEMETTCGDCVEGRCHWGGERSAEGIAAAKAGRDHVDPHYGACGCARHAASVDVRARYARWRAAGIVSD